MPRRFPHPVLVFSCLGHSFDHLLMLIYPTAVLAMGAEFGRGYGELIVLMTPSVILFGAGAIPAGWLGDRWSARGTLIIMFVGLGTAAVLTGFARSPFEVGLGLAAIGLFASIYHPVATAVVVRYAARRGRALGINGIFGGLGMAVAPGVSGFLTSAFGWRAAFIVPGLVCLGVGAAFAWIVREIAPAAPPTGKAQAGGGNGRSVLPIFAAIVMVGVCVGFLYQTETVAMPKVFQQRLTFLAGELSAVGGFTAAIFVCGAAAQYVGGMLADRFSMKWLVAAALSLQVLIILAIAQAWNWPLFALAVLMAVFTLGLQPVMDSLVAHYVPAAWHARAYGARFLSAIVISSLSVPAVGWIFETTGGFDWLFYGLVGVAALGALTALRVPSERRVVAAGTI
jgi:MFS family permease